MERVAAVKWHEDAHHFLIRLASRLLESFARLPHLLSDRFSLPLDSKILLLQVCLDLALLFGVHMPDLLLTDTHESAFFKAFPEKRVHKHADDRLVWRAKTTEWSAG